MKLNYKLTKIGINLVRNFQELNSVKNTYLLSNIVPDNEIKKEFDRFIGFLFYNIDKNLS